MKPTRAQRTAASLSNAQMIYNILQGEPTPRDAAATIAAVHAALIWTIEPDDEANARKIAGEMVESIVTLWRVNKAAVEQQAPKETSH